MIHFSDVTKQAGSRVLFRNGTFQINSGEKLGLVGPNGNGKSTVFKILVGEEGIESGTVSKPEKISIGYFSQNVGEMSGRSVLEEVKSAAIRVADLKSKLSLLEARLSEDLSDDEMTKTLESYGLYQSEFEQLGGYEIDSRATADRKN